MPSSSHTRAPARDPAHAAPTPSQDRLLDVRAWTPSAVPRRSVAAAAPPLASRTRLGAAREAVARALRTRAYELAALGLAIAYVTLLLLALTLRSAPGGWDALDADDAPAPVGGFEARFHRSGLPVINGVCVGLFAVDFGLKLLVGHAPRPLRSGALLLEAAVVASACAFTALELAARYSTLPSVARARGEAPLQLALRVGRSVRLLLAMLKLGALREASRRRRGPLGGESAVEAPVRRVLALLDAMTARAESAAERQQLEWMREVIAANRLYTTVLSARAGGPGGGAVDAETAAWLRSQYAVQSASPPPPNARSSFAHSRRDSLAQGGRGSLASPFVVGRAKRPSATLGLHGTATSDDERALRACLADVDAWGFDVFALNRASAGRPLVPLVMAICARHNFFERFDVEPAVLARCVCAVQASYAPVPYHNRLHAADVTQTLYALLACDAVADHVDDPELFAAVLAAACHDLGHPGLNNPYHVKHVLEAAVLYNDASVLEHSHASRAWQALTAAEHNVLANVAADEAATIRQTLISMILGTDMSGHFDELSKFGAKTSAGGLQIGCAADTQLLLRMALHCADVSNPAKAPDLCIPWAVRVMDEFFMQGDKEKSLGHAASPFMDRESTTVSKCQAGFITHIVTPLFEAWHGFCESDAAELALDGCQHNAAEWLRCGDERIGEWLRARGLERSDPLLTDHGPRRDPRCTLPPVSAREAAFHHDAVVEFRARAGEGGGDTRAPPDQHAIVVEPALLRFEPAGRADSRLRSARRSIHAVFASALMRAPRLSRKAESAECAAHDLADDGVGARARDSDDESRAAGRAASGKPRRVCSRAGKAVVTPAATSTAAVSASSSLSASGEQRSRGSLRTARSAGVPAVLVEDERAQTMSGGGGGAG